jgi:hypothetical protein
MGDRSRTKLKKPYFAHHIEIKLLWDGHLARPNYAS